MLRSWTADVWIKTPSPAQVSFNEDLAMAFLLLLLYSALTQVPKVFHLLA